MVNKVVSNTGPLIHLSEINFLTAIDIFQEILIPEEVESELKRNKISIPKKIICFLLKPESKDIVKILTNQENLDLGEASAIALALQEKADIFLTDDLEARNIAKHYNLETHGTLGIILRVFRENIIDKKTAIEKVRYLQEKSSLFITRDLVEYAIKEIENYSSKLK